ncbi:MAG: cytochrome c oxidase assembly protein [Candidatus Tumulicola sp.]
MIAASLGVAAIIVYLIAVRAYDVRYPRRRFSALRVGCFVTGGVVMGAALLPPADALADQSFAAHMAQHLILTVVGPPLLLLGAPLLLCVALPPARVARAIAHVVQRSPIHALFSPVVAWLFYVTTLWAVHLSPLYEAALQHEWVHGLEHALFVVAAMLFWMPVVQVGYAPWPLSYAARTLYLFLAIPQGAFLGLAIYSARYVLYPHYALGRPLAQALLDQQNGGAMMWMAGGLVLLVAFIAAIGIWATNERGEALASLHHDANGIDHGANPPSIHALKRATSSPAHGACGSLPFGGMV